MNVMEYINIPKTVAWIDSISFSFINIFLHIKNDRSSWKYPILINLI